MSQEAVRLQKYLAERGVASRRRCEEYIADGRVRVNGVVVVQQGAKVRPGEDSVELDGHPIAVLRDRRRTIMVNKPRGLVCSTSARQGRTVYELFSMPAAERLVPVGRLDKDSEGLLLLSNDGELVHRLTHPRHGHTKVYEVEVSGAVTEDVLHRLRSPIRIGNRTTAAASVCVLRRHTAMGGTVLRFALEEGRNRQIRRLCAAAGLRVERLVRVRVGRLGLGSLEPGKWRDLTPADIALAVGATEPAPGS
jgi:23S rRNA pseudouridine2605 synthase